MKEKSKHPRSPAKQEEEPKKERKKARHMRDSAKEDKKKKGLNCSCSRYSLYLEYVCIYLEHRSANHATGTCTGAGASHHLRG